MKIATKQSSSTIMELFIVVLSMAILLVTVNSKPCHRIDREALLSFKVGMKNDPSGALLSWNGKDCCYGWKGVECDFDTGRVVKIDLQGDEWDQDVSFYGTLSESLGKLSSLEVLRVTQWKYIGGGIPSSLYKLSNLTVLDLEGNKLNGGIPTSLCKLPSLQYLSLSKNSLSGSLPYCVSKLKNLLRLTISRNRLSGSLPSSLGMLTSLKELSLSNNKISGSIPGTLGRLQSLERLQLAGNALSGAIPYALGDLPKLLLLALGGNRLSGKIPASLGKLCRLQSLQLGGNNLEGIIPGELSKLSHLISLDLSRNNLDGAIPRCFENLTRISSFDVSRNKFREFQPCMKAFDSPLYLDLSYNDLKLGTIPTWIQESTKVYCLHLANSGLKMDINDFRPSNPGLYRSIDLSSNEITGDATKFFEDMSEIREMNISNNRISYDLSNFRIEGLVSLDVHNNMFFGTLQYVLKNYGHGCGIGGCMKYVDISRNRLSGRLPRLTVCQKNLQWLDLSHNMLSGPITPSLALLKDMRHLDLSHNGLQGFIPVELVTMRHLTFLNVSNNRLCKRIPQQKPFLSFTPAAYSNNKCLCGAPLKKICKR